MKSSTTESSSSGSMMVRSELSRNSEVKAALKMEDALNRSASWMWKAVLASPTSKVTVATSAHLKGVLAVCHTGS